jgi:hypothetical protein
MVNCKYIILFLLVFTPFACKNNHISSIPSYAVSLQLNLTASYPTFKNSINQYLIINERILETDRIGFGGVLVCTGRPENGVTRYYAYDLACPVEVKKNIKVVPLTDDLFKVRCEECGSEYYVGDGFGMPASGKAKEPLRAYKTIFNGDILHIYN